MSRQLHSFPIIIRVEKSCRLFTDYKSQHASLCFFSINKQFWRRARQNKGWLRWLKVHIFSEYMNFNIRRYFHIVHLLKRIWQITILNFFTLGWKVKISNLAHFYEDGTKGKIPSKIKSLAGINQLEKLKLNGQYRFIGLFVKAQSI